MNLETKHIDDWQEFIESNDIDIIGFEPLWNTIWNSGFHSTNVELPAKFPNVFAFEHNGYVWLGLTACGMDCTPHLALAWSELFPDCDWLPTQFINSGLDLRSEYVKSCLGKADAKKIYALIGKTIDGQKIQLDSLTKDLEVAYERL